MLQSWKTPRIVKGLLYLRDCIGSVARVSCWYRRLDSARYCYSVWLRHLSILGSNSFRVTGARDCSDLVSTTENIKRALAGGLNESNLITYRVPWDSPDVIAHSSLDLIFSQAVLEHVDRLDETYMAMSAWTKTGATPLTLSISRLIISLFWNGHWAYGDFEWRLVRGRREFLLNREPLSKHLECAQKAGFEILQVTQNYDENGLPQYALAPRFRRIDTDDRRIRGRF